jgi:regulator of PEP synthase PpsR (kinase-PPPase family)
MGNAVLIQFPELRFERHLIPFITTVHEARRVVAVLDEAMAGPTTPLAFSTTAVTEIREVLHTSTCPLIDFFDLHMSSVEAILGVKGVRVAARLHGVGDIQRYNARMAAVEYAIEHDDGQSPRALDKAEVILLAPSRCGKTHPGPQRAAAQLPLRLPRAVQLRTATRRGPVPQLPHPGDQLLGQVRRGDVHGHLAVP